MKVTKPYVLRCPARVVPWLGSVACSTLSRDRTEVDQHV